MTERTGIFAGDAPIEITRRWLDEAAKTEINDPNAVQLATVDAEGRPNVRTVLLKEIEDDAFVIYTNYDSTKGQEIAATGQAAFVFHWKSLGRQIRVRGAVTKEDGDQADAYYFVAPAGVPRGGPCLPPIPTAGEPGGAARPRYRAHREFGRGPAAPRPLGRLPHHALRDGVLGRW